VGEEGKLTREKEIWPTLRKEASLGKKKEEKRAELVTGGPPPPKTAETPPGKEGRQDEEGTLECDIGRKKRRAMHPT